jgi:hypothetical protein
MAIIAQYDSQDFLARWTLEDGCCCVVVAAATPVLLVGVVAATEAAAAGSGMVVAVAVPVVPSVVVLLPNGKEKGEREARGEKSEEIAEPGVVIAAVVAAIVVVADAALAPVESFEALCGVVAKLLEESVVDVVTSSLPSGLSTAHTESRSGSGSAKSAMV